MRLCALIAASFMAFSSNVHAGSIAAWIDKDGKSVLNFDGEITAGDADAFTAAIKKENDSGRAVKAVRLNSPGGLVTEGARIAALVRFAKLATIVIKNKTCASACFLIFAGGAAKYANRSALIGVHGASAPDGETRSSQATTVDMIRYAKTLGVPDGILAKMATTLPANIYWLTEQDLLSMRVIMAGVPPAPTKQTPDTPDELNLPKAFSPDTAAPQAPTASMSPDQLWEYYVTLAVEVSAKQNGGVPNSNRFCQPDIQVCSTVIWFTNRKGLKMIVRKGENADGDLVSRDICVFNATGDVRTCFEWPDLSTVREMSDINGSWHRID